MENVDLILTQIKYARNLLVKVDITQTKPNITPMSTFDMLSTHVGQLYSNHSFYKSIVEALQ